MRSITLELGKRTFTIDKDGNISASGRGRVPLAIHEHVAKAHARSKAYKSKKQTQPA